MLTLLERWRELSPNVDDLQDGTDFMLILSPSIVDYTELDVRDLGGPKEGASDSFNSTSKKRS